MKRYEGYTLRWICRYGQKQLWMTLALSVLSAGISLGYIGIAWVSRQILDSAGKERGSLAFQAAVLGGILLGQSMMNLLSGYLRVSGQVKMENRMRTGILERLMKSDYQEFMKMHSGEYMTRLTSDIEIVCGGTIQFLPQLCSIITRVIAGLLVMYMMSREITLLAVSGGFLIIAGAKIIGKYFRHLHMEVQSRQGKVRTFLQECLENMMVVKAFQAEEETKKQLTESQWEYYRARVRQNMTGSLAGTGFYLITAVGYYAALVWGASQIAGGKLTIGTLVAFLQIFEQLRAPFRNLSGTATQYDKVMASAERLIELEEKKMEAALPACTEEAGRRLYETATKIRMEKCSFSYEGQPEKPVFKNVSLTIPIGSMTAVVGSSGCGKSTCFHMLMGFLSPQEGEVFLEAGNDQIPIGRTTRRLFAYVPQGNLILSGTIRENLLLGNKDATDEMLNEAVKIACLEEVIEELPQGLDSVLRERGAGLSEGQRQRIAIARAIVSKAQILLLDECTSALDAQTEEKLLKNLAEQKEKTILCITHRKAALRWCRYVIEFDNGLYNQEETDG